MRQLVWECNRKVWENGSLISHCELAGHATRYVRDGHSRPQHKLTFLRAISGSTSNDGEHHTLLG